MQYMLKYDSVHGQYKGEIGEKDGKLVVDGKEIAVFAARILRIFDWKGCGAEYNVESTGVFTTTEKARLISRAGREKVSYQRSVSPTPRCLSWVSIRTVHQGHEGCFKRILHNKLSRAHIAKVLNDKFGIVEGFDDYRSRNYCTQKGLLTGLRRKTGEAEEARASILFLHPPGRKGGWKG
jgi:glyceraldehyde 3-phosphate dehydrogenase